MQTATMPAPMEQSAQGSRRRVLLVATHVVQYASPLYRLLAADPRLDFRVVYCSLQGAEPGVDPEFGREVKWDLPLLEGYSWSQIPNRSLRPGLGRFFGLCNPGLWKLIRGGGFDVVILCTGYMVASHWIALVAAKSKRLPVVFSSDTSVIESRDRAGWKSWVKPFVLGCAYRAADVLMTLSQAGRKVALRVGMSADRIAPVRSAMDKEEWQARAAAFDRKEVRRVWNVPPDAVVAFYCAKLQPWKCPLDLVNAFAKAAVPGSYLVVAGDGPQRAEVELAISSLGIAANVRMLGFVNASQLPGHYKAADIFVLPSRYDPCPFVVPEAMFSGTPVILSDAVVGREEMILPGKTGFLYPCGDVDALAEVLRKTLSDRALLDLLRAGVDQQMRSWTGRAYVDSFVDGVELAWSRKHPIASEAAISGRISQRSTPPGEVRQRPLKLLIIASHPVQYMAPTLRRLAARPDIDLQVAYCSLRGAQADYDPDFGVSVKWDVPLLEGYSWIAPPNKGAQRKGFWELNNPDLKKIICAEKFDAVLSYVGYTWASFWIARYAAKRCRVGFVFGTDTHTMKPRDGKAWKIAIKKVLWPYLFRLADQVIVPSIGGFALMRRLGIPAARITKTPFAVDNEWWKRESAKVDRAAVRKEWKLHERQPVIVFCAKLQPWKRPADLLQAFAQANIPESVLFFVGEGRERGELEKQASRLGIGERVRFLGFLNQTQLPPVYTAADLFVLPSSYEPFGVVVNEAMCCGCPVIASDQVGAAADLVAPVRPEFVFPAGNVAALASALRAAFEDREKLRQTGRASYEQVESHSPDAVVAGIVEAATRAAERAKCATS